MQYRKVKNNAIIYQQGDLLDSIYVLVQGNVQLSRNVHLFKENPNSVYIDRRKLINRNVDHNGILPYADFTTVYNYKPAQKTVQIGVMTPIVLFGEEELVEHKNREVSAICSSLQCSYYQIKVDQLRQILTPKFQDFVKSLKASVKQKIIHRQNILATTLNIQNSSRIECFYAQDQETKPQAMKFKISKMNNSFMKNINPQIKITSNDEKLSEEQEPIKPFYNTFNFHKMNKLLLDKKLKKQDIQHKKSSLQGYFESSRVQKMSSLQTKIYSQSHTWREVGRQVHQQQQFSRKTDLNKHFINLDFPLIDEKYFQKIQKATRKLQQKRKINLSFKVKKRVKTNNQKLTAFA